MHTCFKYEGSIFGRAFLSYGWFARGSLDRQSLGQWAENQSMSGQWLAAAHWCYMGALREPPGSRKDHRGGTAVSCASLMSLAAWCSCTGTWDQASSLQYIIIAHFWTFNHKLAIPTVLAKKPQTNKQKKMEGERDLTLVSGMDSYSWVKTRISSCAISGFQLFLLLHCAQV